MAAFSYSFDSVNGVVTIAYRQLPSLQDWRHLMIILRGHPGFRTGLSLLVDCSAIAVSRDPQCVQQLTEYVKTSVEELGYVWVAVIVSNSSAEPTPGLDHRPLKELRVAVFTERFTAREWLMTRSRGTLALV